MKIIQGVVTSAKMQKTVVVRTERRVQHPRYKKYVVERGKVQARDGIGCHEGDVVVLAPSRRMSKKTCWRVLRVVGRRATRDRPDDQDSAGARADAAARSGEVPGGGS